MSENLTNDEQKFHNNLRRIFGDNYIHFYNNPDKLDYNEYIVKIKEYLSKYINRNQTRKKADNISSSQLRNIFSKVKPCKNRKPEELYMIRPHLAYAAGRADNRDFKEILFFFDQLISTVKDENDVNNFVDFFESIIAYHKYYGGK